MSLCDMIVPSKSNVPSSVETFRRVHDGGYVHTGKRKRTFTNLIKRHDKNGVENTNQFV